MNADKTDLIKYKNRNGGPLFLALVCLCLFGKFFSFAFYAIESANAAGLRTAVAEGRLHYDPRDHRSRRHAADD
jgi:hypothetical protein